GSRWIRGVTPGMSRDLLRRSSDIGGNPGLAAICDLNDLIGELISQSGSRGNVPVQPGFVTQGFSQHGNVSGNVAFFDDRPPPDLSDQGVFLDDGASISDEEDEDVERFWRQRHRCSVTDQQPPGKVDAKGTEVVAPKMLGHMTIATTSETAGISAA